MCLFFELLPPFDHRLSVLAAQALLDALRERLPRRCSACHRRRWRRPNHRCASLPPQIRGMLAGCRLRRHVTGGVLGSRALGEALPQLLWRRDAARCGVGFGQLPGNCFGRCSRHCSRLGSGRWCCRRGQLRRWQRRHCSKRWLRHEGIAGPRWRGDVAASRSCAAGCAAGLALEPPKPPPPSSAVGGCCAASRLLQMDSSARCFRRGRHRRRLSEWMPVLGPNKRLLAGCGLRCRPNNWSRCCAKSALVPELRAAAVALPNSRGRCRFKSVPGSELLAARLAQVGRPAPASDADEAGGAASCGALLAELCQGQLAEKLPQVGHQHPCTGSDRHQTRRLACSMETRHCTCRPTDFWLPRDGRRFCGSGALAARLLMASLFHQRFWPE